MYTPGTPCRRRRLRNPNDSVFSLESGYFSAAMPGIRESAALKADKVNATPVVHRWKSKKRSGQKVRLVRQFYLILEGNASMLRFEKWGETHRHPYGENIPSQRSSELFQSITDESRHAGSILYQ